MRLTQQEFVRRFGMHIVPYKFVRIRHYGILSNRSKKVSLAAARNSLGVAQMATQIKTTLVLAVNEYLHYCSSCRKVTVHELIDVLPPVRGSPIMVSPVIQNLDWLQPL